MIAYHRSAKEVPNRTFGFDLGLRFKEKNHISSRRRGSELSMVNGLGSDTCLRRTLMRLDDDVLAEPTSGV
jgi:hypothetical protein